MNICRFFYDDSCITVPVQLTSAMHLLKILFKTATFRVYRNFFLTPDYSTWPHRPTSWAGSRAALPVSE